MKRERDRLTDLIATEAAAHYAAQRAGDADADGELAGWLRRSPTHVAEYLALVRLASDLPAAARQLDIPLDQLIADARQSGSVVDLAGLRPEEAPARRRPGRRMLVLCSLAAAGLMAIAVGLTTTSNLRILHDPAGSHSERHRAGTSSDVFSKTL